MPPTKCCCCFRLRTGTLWIAWMNLGLCLLSLLVFSVALFVPDDRKNLGKRWYEQSHTGMVTAYVIQAVWILPVLCLVVGAHLEGRARWMLPWVFVTVVNVGAFIGLGVYDLTLGNYSPLGCALAGGVIMMYCAHIVWSYYQEVTVLGSKDSYDISETDSDVTQAYSDAL